MCSRRIFQQYNVNVDSVNLYLGRDVELIRDRDWVYGSDYYGSLVIGFSIPINLEVGPYVYDICAWFNTGDKDYENPYTTCHLAKIVSHASTPPTLKGITNKQYMTIPVIVPEGSLALYQAHEDWKNFWNMKEGSNSGINPIDFDAQSSAFISTSPYTIHVTGLSIGQAVKVFTLEGRLVNQAKAISPTMEFSCAYGVYIIAIGNQRVKVLVK